LHKGGKIGHLVVPIFIPYRGCPHRCVFCEQERITGKAARPVTGEEVEDILEDAIHAKGFNLSGSREIAFYGGTFTGLPLAQMKGLLHATAFYLKEGLFHAIRISTRPDALDDFRLEILKDHGVQTVELGAQSMDNRVLSLSRRGHRAEDTVRAVSLLRDHGFRVGLQLMPGLPGDCRETFRSTIAKVIELGPDMVRLYPALVIRGTELALWYAQGRFRPWDLNEAVEVCAEACESLESKAIQVIRMGLMSSPSLLEEGQIVAGPWHPAFGSLVRSAIYRKRITPFLPEPGTMSRFTILSPKREIPLIRGYKNQGLQWVEKKTGAKVVGVKGDDSIPVGEIRIQGL